MANPVVGNILKSGAVLWYAPEGETLPDETSIDYNEAWGGNWARLGFTKEPLVLAYEDETHEVEVEEFLMPVNEWKIGEKARMETMLAELTADYLQLGIDGTVTETAAGVGQKAFEQLIAGNSAQKTVYTIGFEGVRYSSAGVALPIRIGFYRCTIRLNGELEFSKRSDDYTGVPVQIKAMADTANSGRAIWFQRVTGPSSS